MEKMMRFLLPAVMISILFSVGVAAAIQTKYNRQGQQKKENGSIGLKEQNKVFMFHSSRA